MIGLRMLCCRPHEDLFVEGREEQGVRGSGMLKILD